MRLIWPKITLFQHLKRERLSSYKKTVVPAISSTVSTIESIDMSQLEKDLLISKINNLKGWDVRIIRNIPNSIATSSLKRENKERRVNLQTANVKTFHLNCCTSVAPHTPLHSFEVSHFCPCSTPI